MKLYAHQKEIRAKDPLRTGLFLGTGSGKTRIALLLADGSALVVAPKTQCEDQNWQRELATILAETRLTTLKVVSKEWFRDHWRELPRYDTFISDEAHTQLGVTPDVRWKNKVPYPKASQTYEAVEAYIELHKPTRVYLVTATIMRNPMTVWAAAQILGVNWDWYKFRARFYVRLPMPGREVYVARDDDASKDKLAELVRRLGYVGRLEDFFDVPAQTFKTFYIDLTAKQKARIKEMALEYPEPIVRLGKVHQIENGVLAGDQFNAPEFFDNGKIAKLIELAIEFPKMVVFVKYTAQIEQIATALRREKLNVLTLTGATKDRGGVIAEANAATQCVFIAQAQISAGWELPAYPVMVFASMTYSWVDYDQALGRIQRANNIKKNLYIKLVTRPEFEGKGQSRRMIGGIDAAVEKSINNKQDFNERIYLKV